MRSYPFALRRVSQILSASTADNKNQKKIGERLIVASWRLIFQSGRNDSTLESTFNIFQPFPNQLVQMSQHVLFSNVMTVMTPCILSVYFDLTSQGSSSGVPGLHGLILQALLKQSVSRWQLTM